MTIATKTQGAWSGPAEVFAYRKAGDHYHALTIVAPEVCSRALPGQFISIRSIEDKSLLLRRAFSIHQVDRRPGWAGTIEIIFDIRGKGTDLLARARQHTQLDVMGPLGRPFRFPREPTNCLLVGGGSVAHRCTSSEKSCADTGTESTSSWADAPTTTSCVRSRRRGCRSR